MKTLLRLSVLSTLFLFGFVYQGSANDIQVLICEAGQNFGQAVARANIAIEFGSTDFGPQERAMFQNLDNAVRYVDDIEASLPEPWATIRKDNQHASRIRTLVDGLRKKWPTLPAHQKVGEIEEIYKSYLQNLRYTYNTGRPDVVQKKPNCDSKIMQLCFYFGIAKIASETAGDPERPIFVERYQRFANSSITGNIERGLDLAMDSGHRPFNGHSEKICCGFGQVDSWKARPKFRSDTPTSTYLTYEVEMKEIIRLANPGYECSQDTDHGLSFPYATSSTRGWETLSDKCFDDPRYKWLLRNPRLLEARKPMFSSKQGEFQVGNLSIAPDLGSDFAGIWYESPYPAQSLSFWVCPCGKEYEKVKKAEGIPSVDRNGNIIPNSYATGPLYTYMSERNRAAYFKIFIEEKINPEHIKSYAYYKPLAQCVLGQLEDVALHCNCSDETDMIDPRANQTDNAPNAIRADGTDTPSNYPPQPNPMDGGDRLEWLNSIKPVFLSVLEMDKDKQSLKSEENNAFETSQTRYIGFELGIECQPTSQSMAFTIDVTCFKASGEELIRYSVDRSYPPDKDVRYFLDGYLNSTSSELYKPGEYYLEIYVEDKFMGRKNFTIY